MGQKFQSRDKIPKSESTAHTSVVRILKFDNPIRSEKFQKYPNPI